MLYFPAIREKKSLNKLQLVLNMAARFLTRSLKCDHITPVLASLHLLPVKARTDFKNLLLTYKVLHVLAPTYLSNLVLLYIPTVPRRKASLLSLEFRIKQLEAGLSPIELHFYVMICLSMWETKTRSQPLSVLKTLFFNRSYDWV